MRKAHVLVLGLLVVAASGCVRFSDISKEMTRPKLRKVDKGFEQFHGTYKVGIPDSVNINIPDHPDLSGTYELRPDGNISFPLLGDVYIEGLTPMQLAETMVKRLERFVKKVDVMVTVTGPRSHHFYIYSRSRQGGTRLGFTGDISALDALSMHGGWSRQDFSSRIRLLRNYPLSPGKEFNASDTEIYRVRGCNFVRGDFTTDIIVQENDVVYIPATWLAEATYFISDLTAPIRSIAFGVSDMAGIPYDIERERLDMEAQRDRDRDRDRR